MGLTGNLKGKADQARTGKDKKEMIMEEGTELSPEELALVSGGWSEPFVCEICGMNGTHALSCPKNPMLNRTGHGPLG